MFQLAVQLRNIWRSGFFAELENNTETKHKNSRSQMFYKIDVFKNFVKFTGKHLC